MEMKRYLRLLRVLSDALAEAAADLKAHTREGDRTAVVAITSTESELSYSDKRRVVDEAQKKADLSSRFESRGSQPLRWAAVAWPRAASDLRRRCLLLSVSY